METILLMDQRQQTDLPKTLYLLPKSSQAKLGSYMPVQPLEMELWNRVRV